MMAKAKSDKSESRVRRHVSVRVNIGNYQSVEVGYAIEMACDPGTEKKTHDGLRKQLKQMIEKELVNDVNVAVSQLED